MKCFELHVGRFKPRLYTYYYWIMSLASYKKCTIFVCLHEIGVHGIIARVTVKYKSYTCPMWISSSCSFIIYLILFLSIRYHTKFDSISLNF